MGERSWGGSPQKEQTNYPLIVHNDFASQDDKHQRLWDRLSDI